MSEFWPRISVVTVVRNNAATLEHAMQSVFAQNYPNLEYLVLDGASTDGTQDIIARFRDFIDYTHSKPDNGPNDAYNEAISRATGQIIGLLNADDWYEPEILRAVGKAFLQNPDIDMVTCEAHLWQRGANGKLDLVRAFSGRSLNVSPTGSPMPNARFFRRDLFTRFGNFEVMNHLGQRMIASDLEFLLRLSEQTVKNHILPRTGYNYLMHEGSITMGANPARERQMYEERAHIAKVYLQRGRLSIYSRRLKRWHRRGTTRAALWRLKEGKRREAWALAREGMRISGALWLGDFLRLVVARKG